MVGHVTLIHRMAVRSLPHHPTYSYKTECSAFALGARGRMFKSCLSDQLRTLSSIGRASACRAEGNGIETRSVRQSRIAQLVERALDKREVGSSSLPVRTK